MRGCHVDFNFVICFLSYREGYLASLKTLEEGFF